MSKSEFRKLDIACEYLDMAMQQYIDGHNYFCIIHLAGAAEELFCEHLPPEVKPIHEIAIQAEKSFHILETGKELKHAEAKNVWTGVRNEIKHMRHGKATIFIDSALEAEHAIEAALINFNKLNLPKSHTLWKYEDCTCEKMQRHSTTSGLLDNNSA